MLDNKKRPLLSICIPTYNRAIKLNRSLSILKEQLVGLNDEVELLVSDNHSPDNTQKIVSEFIKKKELHIKYNRNEKNLGFDGNFFYCINQATGKYIWLLGDDDFLKKGILKRIIDILRENDVGMLHLRNVVGKEKGRLYTNVDEYVITISYWITYISGNIFLKEVVPKVDVDTELLSSNILQVPFYQKAMMVRPSNYYLRTEVFVSLEDDNNNGGYNFVQVFCDNYLRLTHNFIEDSRLNENTYSYLKKDVCIAFLLPWIARIYVEHKNKEMEQEHYWSILLKHYKYNAYFYFSVIQIFSIRFMKHIVKTHLNKVLLRK